MKPREELLQSAAKRYLDSPLDIESRDTLCVCALNFKLGELSDKLDNLTPIERIVVLERMPLTERLLYHALQLTFDAKLEAFYAGCQGDRKGVV